MAIPASVIVSITPRVIASTGNSAVLSGLILTKQTGFITADNMVARFSSQNMVGETFGTENPLYTLAGYYFGGYDNSQTKPSELVIGQWCGEEALPAWIKSTITPPSLSTLKGISAGVLNITIDGELKELTAIDLSTATSYSDVAAKITTSLASDATMTFTSNGNSFIIETASTGTTATIGYAQPVSGQTANDLGLILGLTESDAPTISTTGLDQMNASANMNAIVNKYANWATFTTEWEPDEDEAIDLGTWAGQHQTDYLYVPWDTDKNACTQNASNTLAAALDGQNLEGVAYPTWEGYQDNGIASTTPRSAVMVLGACASIDWDRTNSTITLAFKTQSGIAATVDSETDYTNLINNNYNFMGNYATKNAQFVLFYNGGMFGDYRFIDNYVNAIWLNNELQYQIMNGLSVSSKVPYTERGYTMIRAWILGVVEKALNNGVIEPGITLDNIQIQQLQQEIGEDVSEDLESKGYYVVVADPGATARQNRESPVCSLFYTSGGAVQRIDLMSTLLL